MNRSSNIQQQNQQQINATAFILEENGKLKEDIKSLKLQIKGWKDGYHDAHRMLDYVDKQGPKNPAAKFYNPSIDRIIEKLQSENQVLIEAVSKGLSSPDPTQALMENATMKSQVKDLRDELEKKFKHCRRLEISLENSSDRNRKEIGNLSSRNNKLHSENRSLKSSILLQENTKSYLRSIVDGLRKEFLEVFVRAYNEEGDKFLDAVKELDQKGLPEALLKPLQENQATDTEDLQPSMQLMRPMAALQITKDPHIDGGYDSGVGSLNEDLRQASIQFKSYEEEKQKMANVIEKQGQEISNLKNEIIELKKDHELFINDIFNSPEGRGKSQQTEIQLKAMNDEVVSLRIAVS